MHHLCLEREKFLCFSLLVTPTPTPIWAKEFIPASSILLITESVTMTTHIQITPLGCTGEAWLAHAGSILHQQARAIYCAYSWWGLDKAINPFEPKILEMQDLTSFHFPCWLLPDWQAWMWGWSHFANNKVCFLIITVTWKLLATTFTSPASLLNPITLQRQLSSACYVPSPGQNFLVKKF